MAFFDKIGESLTSAGKEVTQKAREVSEITKLKLDIKAKEDYVQGQYALLGMDYYAKHKDEENCDEAEQFFLIREALAEIDRMEAEVLHLKGAVECQNCGAQMPVGASYCSSCGAKINDPAEENKTEEAETADGTGAIEGTETADGTGTAEGTETADGTGMAEGTEKEGAEE